MFLKSHILAAQNSVLVLSNYFASRFTELQSFLMQEITWIKALKTYFVI